MNEASVNKPNEQNAPTAPATNTAPPKPSYEVDRRERVLLPLCVALGILAADLLMELSGNWLGLGIPTGIAVWYAVLLWYVGPKRLVESRSQLFFGAVALLSLTFVLFSHTWFRFWNLGLLLVLLTVHAFQISGVACKPWYMPSMLWERFLLLLDGMFGRLGALGVVFRQSKGPNTRRRVMAGVGILIAFPLVFAAAALLASADQVFDRLTANILNLSAIGEHWDEAAAKVILGLFMAPFLFSLLYALGRPKPLERKEKTRTWSLDSIVPVIVLAALDALYLFFVGVQSAALFGGPAYLAQMGISYAEYARSGFFQLVFVTALNLAVVLILLQLGGRGGKGWRAVQALATALVVLSGVILGSAAWRMSLYVLAYGLSFKRALTYWGMVMIALLLGAACRKVWREEFRFFRFAAVAVLVGWLVLNYANVDRIVAEYNVDRYLSGSLESLDLYYLSGLSYEALPALERLDGNTLLAELDNTRLSTRLSTRGMRAAAECAHWETWSLPAWLAYRSYAK